MDEVIKLLITYAFIPVVLGIGAFIMKSIHMRLDELEKSMPAKLDQRDVRQIVADKVEPIREDLKELKDKVEKVIDILLKK